MRAPRTPSRLPIAGIVFLFLLFAGQKLAAQTQSPPAWWTDYGVTTGTSSSDFSAANQGEAKNMAVSAVAELDYDLAQFGGAGSQLDNLASMLSGTTSQTSDFSALNQGELKNLAQPFYDRLLALGYTGRPFTSGTYPWATSSGPVTDFALANIGMLKYAFSFDVTYSTSGSSIPDWWIDKYFPGGVGFSGTGGYVAWSGSQVTLLGAYQNGWNPLDFYNGQAPSLTIVSGNGQTGSPGQFVSMPLLVQATDSSGNPLPGAPVTFSVTSGTGDLQPSSLPPPATSVVVFADSNGNAKMYYQLPNIPSNASQVTATTGTGATAPQVAFTEFSDDGGGTYISPFAPSNVIGSLNPDGSQSITWQNNDNGTGQIYIYTGTNGGWVVTGTLPAGTTTYTAPPSVVGNTEIGDTNGALIPFEPIPAVSYAPVALSGSITSTYLRVAMDDQNNAAFGYVTGTDVNGDPTQYSTYSWESGVVSSIQSVPLTGSSGGFRTTSAIDTAGNVYGTDWNGQGFEGQGGAVWDVAPPEPPFVSSTAPPCPTSMGFECIGGTEAYGEICSGSTDIGTIVGYPGGPDSAIVVVDHTVVFDPVLADGGASGVYGDIAFSLPTASTIEYAVSDAGTAFGTAGFPINGPAYWDGADVEPMTAGFWCVRINDSGCVIGWDASGNGSLWQYTGIGSGTATTILSLVPAAYRNQISGITPYLISNRNQTDGTTKILCVASYSPGPGQPMSAAGTFVLTFTGTASTTGTNEFWEAQLPDSFETTNINASGILYGPGELPSTGDTPSPGWGAVALVPAQFVPDYNRDGIIDDNDRGQVSGTNPWHWWVNDSHTSGDIASGNDGVPGTGTPNYSDQIINGTQDLVNWFPLYLEIGPLLHMFPSTGYTYELRSSDSSMDIVIPSKWMPWATFSESDTRSWYTDSITAETLSGTSQQIVVPLTAEGGTNADLSSDFLAQIQSNGYGMMLVEASKTTASGTTSNLELHVISNSTHQDVAEVKFPMQLSGVEDMYRWINLRNIAGQAVTRPTDVSPPTNYPDSLTDGKMFVFVHGYNVSERQSRAWCAEVFKRLYQAGSKAMFTGVSWHGDASQIWSWVPMVGGDSPDYWQNVTNAFDTSLAIGSAVNTLPGTTKVIAAHSLGNMIVSYALQENWLDASAYFLLDAAVASEAYDTTLIDRTDMGNPEWTYLAGSEYYPTRLWASDWHTLFGPGDGRNALTWRGLFDNIGNAYNFYSSGEDVLDLTSSGQYNTTIATQQPEHAWVTQELAKGELLQLLGTFFGMESGQQGGWGFNPFYDDGDINPIPPPAATTGISNTQLTTDPFFLPFSDCVLTDPNRGSAEAQRFAVWTKTLAYAIPALSFATGRELVEGFGQAENFDLENLTNLDGAWPAVRLANPNDRLYPSNQGRWEHGDAIAVSYPFNYLLYQEWVSLGGLK